MKEKGKERGKEELEKKRTYLGYTLQGWQGLIQQVELCKH